MFLRGGPSALGSEGGVRPGRPQPRRTLTSGSVHTAGHRLVPSAEEARGSLPCAGGAEDTSSTGFGSPPASPPPLASGLRPRRRLPAGKGRSFQGPGSEVKKEPARRGPSRPGSRPHAGHAMCCRSRPQAPAPRPSSTPALTLTHTRSHIPSRPHPLSHPLTHRLSSTPALAPTLVHTSCHAAFSSTPAVTPPHTHPLTHSLSSTPLSHSSLVPRLLLSHAPLTRSLRGGERRP